MYSQCIRRHSERNMECNTTVTFAVSGADLPLIDSWEPTRLGAATGH